MGCDRTAGRRICGSYRSAAKASLMMNSAAVGAKKQPQPSYKLVDTLASLPSGGASVTDGSGEPCEPSKDQTSAPGLPVHPVKLPVDCEAGCQQTSGAARRCATVTRRSDGATPQRPPQAAAAPQRGPQAAPLPHRCRRSGRMGPRRVPKKRPPGQQPKAAGKKRLAPRDRRPRADDQPDAHSPRLIKVDPEAVKLYRTEALTRLDVVANARLKTRFRQFRVRALALSTGVLTAFDHTRALSQLCEWVRTKQPFSSSRNQLEDALVKAVVKAHAHETELVRREQYEKRRREHDASERKRVHAEAEAKIQKVEATFDRERRELHAQLRRERARVDDAESKMRELQETAREAASTTAKAKQVLEK